MNAEEVFILVMVLLFCGFNFLNAANWVSAFSNGRRRHPWLGAVGITWVILGIGIALWWLLT